MRARSLVQPIVVVPVLIVVAIVGVWWFAFRPSGDASASASTTRQLATVTRGPMSVNVSAEGTVAAAQTDALSFSSAGTVTAVNVKAGDTVTAGEVLATIDSAALQSSVSSAQADLADANAKLTDDEGSGASSAQIAADQTAVTSADDALANATSALAKASLVATFDGTVSAVNITEGEQLSSSGSGGTATTGTGSGSGQSSAALGSSSSSSRAAASSSSNSSSSASTSAQIEVVSTGRYTVDLAVDSADVGSVSVGQTATVTRTTSSAAGGRFGGGFAAFFNRAGAGSGSGSGAGSGSGSGGTGRSTTTTGATATGLVTAVSRVADASSGVATYPVTIAFDSTGSDFFVGSTVSGDIATNVRQNVVQVSTLAITTTDSGSTVTVATDGTLSGPTETRTVTTGLTAAGNTEITSGLKPGDQVVITITRPGGFSPPAGFQRGSGGGFGGEFPGGARAGG
jgi:multidrug efflux pump subunit AcrA (membrane-fusion protein)